MMVAGGYGCLSPLTAEPSLPAPFDPRRRNPQRRGRWWQARAIAPPRIRLPEKSRIIREIEPGFLSSLCCEQSSVDHSLLSVNEP